MTRRAGSPLFHRCQPTLEATQGQIDGFLSQLPYERHQNWVASVRDKLRICPWVASKVDTSVGGVLREFFRSWGRFGFGAGGLTGIIVRVRCPTVTLLLFLFIVLLTSLELKAIHKSMRLKRDPSCGTFHSSRNEQAGGASVSSFSRGGRDSGSAQGS